MQAGVPLGIGEWFHCESCRCLITPDLWGEAAPCPCCGAFPDGAATTTPQPSTVLDRIGVICSQAYEGAIDPTMRDLAAMVLDEIPSFREET